MKNKQPKEKKPGIGWLFAQAGSWLWFYALSLIMAITSGILLVFTPLLMYFGLKALFTHSIVYGYTIFGWAGWSALNALLAVGISVGALLLSHLVAFHIDNKARANLLRKVLTLPVGFIEQNSTGKLSHLIEENLTNTHALVAHLFPQLLMSISGLIAGLVILFAFNWGVGLISLIPVIIGIICFAFMFTSMKTMGYYMEAMKNINDSTTEYLRAMPIVKTFGVHPGSFRKFVYWINEYTRYAANYARDVLKPYTLYFVMMRSPIMLLAPVGFLLLAYSSDYLQTLLSLLFYLLFMPVFTFMFGLVTFISEWCSLGIMSIGNLAPIINAKPILEPTDPKMPTKFDLTFENVSFTYPGTTHKAVDNLSFSIPQGETWAVIGPSGSGKTTIGRLAARFWDPDSGEVKLGDVNIKDINTRELLKKISWVFQNTRLFKTTIRENILAARPDGTDEEAKQAATLAQCDDIIAKLPDQFDQVVGRDGVYLSGGESQRIALARAIAQNAPVVILDEATAFADPENEAKVQAAFKELSKNKTTLMIAHRLTSIVTADNIMVLEDGKLVEQGKHTELLAKGGLYKQLWDEYQQSIHWKLGSEEVAQ